MNKIPKGRYEHFKGKRYEVLDIALHSETVEPMVIYKALYKGDFPEGTLWVRSLTMFQENVIVAGKTVPRFRYLGKGGTLLSCIARQIKDNRGLT